MFLFLILLYMPRRQRHNRIKGGGLDELGSSFGNLWGSFSQSASNMWDKTKNATKGLINNVSQPQTSYVPSSATYSSSTNYTQPMSGEPTSTTGTTSSTGTTSTTGTSSAYGGKRSRRAKRGGGFSDNIALTGLASRAAPFSGPTAEPHTWVGGKRKTHKRRSSRRSKRVSRGRKSRKH
jgi:hypothetical protein